ncbi:hypothetical protein SK128_009266 [Halocaridina rubra]|uniref:HTH psq-type domain-containing protein n=1 Tax=Halocaridina rubra TaxID=373956 RepID=A0AAN8WXK2_HALRR
MRGLERVLEELMGESAWLKVRSDLYPSESYSEEAPSASSEAEEPQDWNPVAPCFVCQGNPQGSLVPEIVCEESSAPIDGEAVQISPVRTASESPIIPPKVLTPSNGSSSLKASYETGNCTETTLDLSVTKSPAVTSAPLSPPALGGALPKSYSGGSFGGALGPGGRALATMGALGQDAAVASRLPLDLYTANLPPHILPWILQSHLHHLAGVHSAQQQDPPEITLDDKDQQPLDLSAKSQHQMLQMKPEYNNVAISTSSNTSKLSRANTSLFAYERIKTETPTTAVDVKLSSNRGRRRGDMSKRSYTEEELQAALRDIQSGKLGTRRAAVIYGIPRSTLRNKVYKLAMERERNKKLAEQSNSSAAQDVKFCSPQQNGITDTVAGSLGKSAFEDSSTSPEAFRALLRNKMAEKLKEMNRKGISGEDNEKVAETALKYLMENIPKLALNKDNKEISTEILSSISFCPQLSDFIKKVVEERYNEELQRSKSNRLNGSTEIHTVNGFSDDNCDLTVPSYFPSCNGHSKDESESTATTNSNNTSQPLISSLQNSNLKEMIAQMIGQKLGCELPLSKDEHLGNCETTKPQQLPLSFSTCESIAKFSVDKRDLMAATKKSSIVSSATAAGGKGSRPKRGKYRNYDRDNLLKAVQAVQSGEMSVHRAGSFYGVPHSTLEYKVKERHLTRGRNKKDSGSSSNSPAAKIKKDVVRKSADTTTATIDLTGDDTIKNDDKHETTPSVKKPRIDSESTQYGSFSPLTSNSLSTALTQTPVSSGSILPNPFSLWNENPIMPTFLSRYQQDPFYASQMIRQFQDAAIAAKNQNNPGSITPSTNERSTSPSPEEACTQETSVSPPFQGSVLDALLRGKIAAINNKLASNCNSALPNSDTWQVSSSLLSLSKGLVTENQNPPFKKEESSTPPLMSPQNMMPFSALYSLPILAARSTLAAALQQNSSPRDTCSPDVDILPLPLVKESCHPTPVVADQP